MKKVRGVFVAMPAWGTGDLSAPFVEAPARVTGA